MKLPTLSYGTTLWNVLIFHFFLWKRWIFHFLYAKKWKYHIFTQKIHLRVWKFHLFVIFSHFNKWKNIRKNEISPHKNYTCVANSSFHFELRKLKNQCSHNFFRGHIMKRSATRPGWLWILRIFSPYAVPFSPIFLKNLLFFL